VAQRAIRGQIGAIRVGYVPEVIADVVPLSLKAFKDHYPDIEIDVRQGTTGLLLDALRHHQVDIAFTRSAGVAGDLEYEQMVNEALFAALTDAHPLSGRRPALAELAGEPFVLPTYAATQGLRRDIDAACAAAGFTPCLGRETSPLSAVLLLGRLGRRGPPAGKCRSQLPGARRHLHQPGGSTPHPRRLGLAARRALPADR
jgi:DNA-binding transcriptional LysR family regulator